MIRRLRIAILLSGLGHLVHNVEEFGLGMPFIGQSLFPVAVTALLFWSAPHPTRRYLNLLGAWALVVIVGGGGSVLPWPFLPFVPAQTVGHYAAHVSYALMQVPLVTLVWRLRIHPSSHDAPQRLPTPSNKASR